VGRLWDLLSLSLSFSVSERFPSVFLPFLSLFSSISIGSFPPHQLKQIGSVRLQICFDVPCSSLSGENERERREMPQAQLSGGFESLFVLLRLSFIQNSFILPVRKRILYERKSGGFESLFVLLRLSNQPTNQRTVCEGQVRLITDNKTKTERGEAVLIPLSKQHFERKRSSMLLCVPSLSLTASLSFCLSLCFFQ